MEYLDLAKCGMLEQLVHSSIGLPLWQSGMVAVPFLISTLLGMILAFRDGGIAVSSHAAWRWIAIVAGSILISVGFAAVVGEIQYLIFLIRVSKDAFYCTYFEASRALAAEQSVLIAVVVALNILWARMLFHHVRLASIGIPQSLLLAASGVLICTTYVACILLETEIASIAVALCIIGTACIGLLSGAGR